MLESEVAHLMYELEQSKAVILEQQNKLMLQEKELQFLRARTLEVRSEEAYKNLRMQIKRCSADRKRLRKNVEQLVIRLAAAERHNYSGENT